MTSASQLKIGSILQDGNDFLKVVSFEFAGTAQSGRTVKLKLKSLMKGNLFDAAYKADQLVKEADLSTSSMEYLYEDGDNLVMMDQHSFEQVMISMSSIGNAKPFLQPNMKLQVKFFEGKPVHVVFPVSVELEVMQAPPSVRSGGDSNFKEVELENGIKVLAPQFIRVGDKIVVEVETGRYMDRVKKEK